MDAVPSVILLGLLLGLQHATDPDHVVAVATIVTRRSRFLRSATPWACRWNSPSR
ncbi:MAG: hypothetical protein HYV92_05360 [Candidatus Rokubacteria bacterium]|nr:hypothetical protein [Candidatus Rokubacteria bacterium]